MIELGPDEMLDHSPRWLVERYEAMAGNAVIGTTGDPEPHLLADLDGEKVGRARMKDVARVAIRQLSERTVNWTGVAYPNEGWAQEVFGEPDVERLWQAVAFCTRLDEPDPVAAWREHMDRLERRAKALNALGLDRLTYRGPGTELELGLLERVAVLQRALPHGRRAPLRREHAHRGGLHHPRRPAGRRASSRRPSRSRSRAR